MPRPRSPSKMQAANTTPVPPSRSPKSAVYGTAAPQALGYSLQYTRLTTILLGAPAGAKCSLEVLDDVAAHHEDGQLHVIQTKSALGDNPVSNHATSLWKTLFNWSKLVKEKSIGAQGTIFELYVSRKVDGEIINGFCAANNPVEANNALIKAKAIMWGPGPTFPLRAGLTEEIEKYCTYLFTDAQDALLSIIPGIRLVCGSGSQYDELDGLLSGDPFSQKNRAIVRDQLLGWVKRNVDTQIEKGQPAIVSRDEFHAEYTSFIRKIDRDIILKSFSTKADPQKQAQDLSEHENHTFVKQLELIEADYDDKLDAVSDYLRASSDRSYLSKSGEVHATAFDSLDDELRRSWKNLATLKKLEFANHKAEVIGKAIYAVCMQHKTRVCGSEPEPFFIPGCFHFLANLQHVGWHPEYKKLISEMTAANRKAP